MSLEANSFRSACRAASRAGGDTYSTRANPCGARRPQRAKRAVTPAMESGDGTTSLEGPACKFGSDRICEFFMRFQNVYDEWVYAEPAFAIEFLDGTGEQKFVKYGVGNIVSWLLLIDGNKPFGLVLIGNRILLMRRGAERIAIFAPLLVDRLRNIEFTDLTQLTGAKCSIIRRCGSHGEEFAEISSGGDDKALLLPLFKEFRDHSGIHDRAENTAPLHVGRVIGIVDGGIEETEAPDLRQELGLFGIGQRNGNIEDEMRFQIGQNVGMGNKEFLDALRGDAWFIELLPDNQPLLAFRLDGDVCRSEETVD